MAQNPFVQQSEVVQKPNRAVHDLSFTNNLTFKIGKLLPVMTQPVMPGDSVRIKTEAALRLFPMKFPIQTRLNARMHFFYVRTKNIWKNWQNFIGQQGDYVSPYIKSNSKELWNVGGIADHLGIPVSYYGDYGKTIKNPSVFFATPGEFPVVEYRCIGVSDIWTSLHTASMTNSEPEHPYYMSYTLNSASQLIRSDNNQSSHWYLLQKIENFKNTPTITLEKDNDGKDLWNIQGMWIVFTDKRGVVLCARYVDVQLDELGDNFSFTFNPLDPAPQVDGYRYSPIVKYSVFSKAQEGSYYDDMNNEIFSTMYNNGEVDMYVAPGITNLASLFPQDSQLIYDTQFYQTYTEVQTEVTHVVDMDVNPYTDSSVAANGSPIEAIHVSALPFRAYESIYNGFYRDTRNNPLIKNGQPVYNEFVTTTDDGEDYTDYHLFNANWEQDFLTTATQTPQQGIAPLIGITGTGLMSFQDADGKTIYAQATLDKDGKTIIGLQSNDTSLPDGTLQILQDTISAGISINDLRNVNSLQRWLERNLRVGFRYRELVKAQFGVTIDWNELDMPEFIGGMSRPFFINQISQTTNGAGGLTDSLGSYAGQGGLVSESEYIEHYCDDYGYIIGILSVVPTPVYSQSLPKHFLKSSPLDYYSPDFANIGAQPIFNKEVAPLQSVVAARNGATNLDDPLNKVFGYQRPWYDYIANYDGAHGQFRDTLRNFLFHRTFDNIPELGEEFLTVHSDQLNDVFTVTEDTDKVIGEIYFNISAKRPIPEVSIPRLE